MVASAVEAVLIARAQAGDHAAFEAIFTQYQSAICRVPLGHGRFAVVDLQDAERVLAKPWHLCKGYAVHTYREGGRVKTLYLHRYVAGVADDLDVDHDNGLTLDCRRSNLRPATPTLNGQNRQRANRNSKTGIRGVHWHRGKKRYIAAVQAGGRRIQRSGFKSIEEAAAWVATARREHMPYSPEAAGVAR
jgi:hypothetical protein